MRTMQVEKAMRLRDEDMGCPSQGMSALLAGAMDQKPRREHKSTASLENHHCGFCGEIGHKQKGCPKATALLRAQAAGEVFVPCIGDLTGEDRQLAQLVAKMKYNWPEQPSAVYEGRQRRAREEQIVIGHQLCRMSAKDMCEFGQECELLLTVEGATCPNPNVRHGRTLWDHCVLGPISTK